MPIAQLVWYDTGASTGMAVVGVRSSWLEGRGDAGYQGLGRAITIRWVAQVGREARVWNGTRARPPSGHVVAGAAWLSKRKARGGSDELTYRRAEILDVTSECHALLDEWPDAAWGHESFVGTGGGIGKSTKDTLSPIEVYSGLCYGELAFGERARVPFTQSSSFAKTTVGDEHLRAAGCYYPGMRHANDAMRHALLFLRSARNPGSGDKLREAAWPRIFGK